MTIVIKNSKDHNQRATKGTHSLKLARKHQSFVSRKSLLASFKDSKQSKAAVPRELRFPQEMPQSSERQFSRTPVGADMCRGKQSPHPSGSEGGLAFQRKDAEGGLTSPLTDKVGPMDQVKGQDMADLPETYRGW